jgi:hypothetical protein
MACSCAHAMWDALREWITGPRVCYTFSLLFLHFLAHHIQTQTSFTRYHQEFLRHFNFIRSHYLYQLPIVWYQPFVSPLVTSHLSPHHIIYLLYPLLLFSVLIRMLERKYQVKART